MDKDKGWEFLFGENKESGSFRSEDGSEGYIYSDGSGYYKGADGSDGYIYSDGSGYYRGADGSDGYKYSDGSGYFRGGSNNVDAYQYSDGSGYYEDSKHSRSHYWPDDNSDGSSSDEDEDEDYEDDNSGVSYGDYSYNRNYYSRGSGFNFKGFLRKVCKVLNIIKKITIGVVITAVVGFIAYNIYEISKQIPVGVDSNVVQGQQYEEVVVQFVEAGFKNITSKPLNDLTIEEEEYVGIVDHVSIDDNISFASDSEYPNDAQVVVYYHSIELISPPISARDAKNKDYSEVVNAYQEAGFTNIKLEILDDLVFGWFTKDRAVESVVINGETKFSEENAYRPDAEVIITYHTFPD